MYASLVRIAIVTANLVVEIDDAEVRVTGRKGPEVAFGVGASVGAGIDTGVRGKDCKSINDILFLYGSQRGERRDGGGKHEVGLPRSSKNGRLVGR